jgi:four helix bundle protein
MCKALRAVIYRAAIHVFNIENASLPGTRKEYLQFLWIAQGSLKELETQSILAERLSYATSAQVASLLLDSERIGKMLGSLIRSLKAKDAY